jgi:DNA transformation protein
MRLSNHLKGARNIGVTIEKHLNKIGVFSLADLAKMTPVKAYLSICEQNPHKRFPVCYYLYSLQGALLDLHWDNLPAKIKASLRKEVDEKRSKYT